MTEKIYDKLLETHKNGVFQILKIGKVLSHYDFNSISRKKYIWLSNYLEIKSWKSFR